MDNEVKQENDTKSAESAVLESALDDPSKAGDQPAPDDAKPKPKPEPEPESDEEVTEKKLAQYPTRDAAIKGVTHWEKVAGKNAEQSGKKDLTIKVRDSVIDNLTRQVAALERRADSPRKSEGIPIEDSKEADPFEKIVDARIAKLVPEYLKPLQDDESRRRARSQISDMRGKYGESWDGLEGMRQKLIDDWSGKRLVEAEVWQLAVIGDQYLKGQISQGTNEVESIPLVDGKPFDLSGSARSPSKSDVIGEAKSDSDILQEVLDDVPRVPMGVSQLS